MGESSAIVAASLISGASEAYAANSAAKISARTDESNAKIADQQAQDALDRGKVAEGKQRRDVRRFVGAQRARAAANGLVVDEGSSDQLVDETERFGEIDALTIRNNARREAWGYEVSALNSRGAAALGRVEGRQQAINTIATSGMKAYDRYSAIEKAKKGKA
jgi:hypothetical protein